METEIRFTLPEISSKKTDSNLYLENRWTVKTLTTQIVRHYAPVKEPVCYSEEYSAKLKDAQPDKVNIFDFMTKRWQTRKEEANEYLKKIVWYVTNKYKGAISESTAGLMTTLTDIHKEITEQNERNIDTIGNRQIMWNSEIETWKDDMLKCNKIIKENIRKFMPHYQNRLRKIGYYSLDDINEILNRLILHINQIIIGNMQYVLNIELHLKLVFDSTIKERVVKLYYDYSKMKQPILGEDEEVTDSIEQNTEWKLDILNDVMELKKMLEEALPEIKVIPEIATFLYSLADAMKNFVHFENEIVHLLETEIKEIVTKNNPEDDSKLHIWKTYVDMMKEDIIMSRQFIVKSINSWHQALSRLELIKVLTKTAIEQHRHINVFTDEVEVNILLDKLRECSELKLINGYFQKIKLLFDRYEKRIQILYKEELGMVETTPKSMAINRDLFEMTRTVLSEFNQPVDYQTIYNLPKKSGNEAVDSVITKIEDYLVIINNWREAYNLTLKLISRELKNEPLLMDMWSSRMRKDVTEYYRHQLDNVHRREKRVKTDVVDVRAAELEEHNLRLRRHIAGIFDAHTQLMKVENAKEGLTRLANELAANVDAQLHLNILNVLRVHEQFRKLKKIMTENQARRTYLIRREIENVERMFYWLASANKRFLQSIRFFGENGNFSPKEAQTAVVAIERLEYLMPSIKSEVIKAIKEVEGQFKVEPAIVWQRGELTYMLKKYNELVYKDTIRSEFLHLQILLKDEVQKIMKSIKQLEGKARQLDNWNPHNLKKLLTDLQALGLYLLLPTFVKKLEIEVPPPAEINEVHHSKQKLSRNSIYGHDYLRELQTGAPFPKNLVKENFLLKVKTLLYESLHKIQRSTRLFFIKTKVDRKSKGNTFSKLIIYRTLMRSVLNLMKGYNLQCERIWLEYIFDILSIMRLIQDKFMNFIIKMLKTTWDWWKLKLENLNVEFIETVDKLANESEKQRSELKYELKPWYGYPDKRPRIGALAKRATNHCRNITKKLCLLFLDYKFAISNILKLIVHIVTQLLAKLTLLKKLMLDDRGLKMIFSNFASFVNRFIKEYYDSFRNPEDVKRKKKHISDKSEHHIVKPEKSLTPDFLLEPGGKSRLLSIPKKITLKITDEEIEMPNESQTDHQRVSSGVHLLKEMGTLNESQTDHQRVSSRVHLLKGPLEINVRGMLFTIGLSSNFEFITDLAKMLLECTDVSLEFDTDLKEKINEKLDMSELPNFDIEKKILELKWILRTKCKYYIFTNMAKLNLLIKHLEKWHIEWNNDIKAICKLYERDPLYH